MKRFFIIFAICFGSLVAVIGAIFGVKFLKGDFNEKVVEPESIYFEMEEYLANDNFKLTLCTPTENVTKDLVDLTFTTSYQTYDKDHYTDGVIIIPKQVKLNQEFEVKLERTNDPELNGTPWIKGGISNIKATSTCVLAGFDTLKVCVDVPVYSTSLVLINGTGTVANGDMLSVLKNFESTGLESENSLVKYIDADSNLNLNAGTKLYMGLRYLPARSAFKYSKISSTNLLVQYYDEISEKLGEDGLNYTAKLQKLQEFKNLFEGTDKTINADRLMDLYKEILAPDSSAGQVDTQFQTFLSSLKTEFNNALRYNVVEENKVGENGILKNWGKIDGTNLFEITSTGSEEMQATTVNLYSYSFANSQIENDTFDTLQDEDLLTILENLYTQQGTELANKKIDKQVGKFNLVDIDVDVLGLSGEVANFNVNQLHTIFAQRTGISDQDTSYLNITLANANNPNLNLQEKILNVGLAVLKRGPGDTWVNAHEVVFENTHFVEVDGVKYYLPIGNKQNYYNAHWQISSSSAVTAEFKLSLAYFKNGLNTSEQDLEELKYFNDDQCPRFNIEEIKNEAMVKWASLEPIDLGIVNLSGVVDVATQNETILKSVKYNKEVDLAELVNIPQSNYYQSYKYFLYAENEDENNAINKYFDVVDEGKEYLILSNERKLYELNSSRIKLVGDSSPEYPVYVMFATIETNAHKQPVLDEQGRYNIIKHSATKNMQAELLSGLSIIYNNSLSTLSVDEDTFVVNVDYAGTVDKEFKVAQNTKDIFSLNIKRPSDQISSEQITTAIQNGDIWIEARDSKNGIETYITYSRSNSNYDFVISTKQVDRDITSARLYIVYLFDGTEYLFPLNIVQNVEGTKEKHTLFTIVENTLSRAMFVLGEGEEAVKSQDVKYILVETKGIPEGSVDPTGVERTYTAVLQDDKTKAVNLFDENGYIKVLVTDFLGNSQDILAWKLTTSNSAIVALDETNQKLIFIGSDDENNQQATINLYLNEFGAVQDTLNFKVLPAGYVSKVSYGESETSQNIQTYSKENLYQFKEISISMDYPDSKRIVLKDLLSMEYTLANNATLMLNFNTFIDDGDDNNTLNTLLDLGNEITDPTMAIAEFNIQSVLAKTITLKFKFVCKEDLNLPVQIVRIIIRPNASVSDVSVKFVDEIYGNDGLLKTNEKYSLFAGVEYQFSFKAKGFPEEQSLYYYFENTNRASDLIYGLSADMSSAQIIRIEKLQTNEDGTTDYLFIVRFYDNIVGDKTLYLTNINLHNANTKIGAGDLNYKINISLNKSLMEKTDVSYTLEPTAQNTFKIGAKNLLIREVNSHKTTANIIYLSSATAEKLININGVIYNSQYMGINVVYEQGESDLETKFEFTGISFEFDSSNALMLALALKDNVGRTLATLKFKLLSQVASSTVNRVTIYDGNKAIVLVHKEQIGDSLQALVAKIFDTQLGNISVDETFERNYVSGIAGNKTITMSTTTRLFEKTEYFATYTLNGVSTKYSIIISRLPFPFVNFGTSYSGLDIYRLFEVSTNLQAYYQDLMLGEFAQEIVEGETYYNLLNIDQFTAPDADPSNETAIFNGYSDYITQIVMADGTSNAGVFAEVATGENGKLQLKVNDVGKESYINVKVRLKPSQEATTTFDIPVLIKLTPNQIVNVNYPNGASNVAKLNPDELLQKDSKMLEDSQLFENYQTEYLQFNLNGQAELDFNDSKYQRLNLYRNDILNVDYKNYMFEVDKVTYLFDKWEDVPVSQFENYVTQSTSGKFVINNYNGARSVRVKIKVTTLAGAENYYYVSVGEVPSIRLYRAEQGLSGEQVVGAEDSLTLQPNSNLYFGGLGGKYSYILKDDYAKYNDKLFIRIVKDGKVIPFDSEENIFLAQDASITANNGLASQNADGVTIVQALPLPAGATFALEVFTVYGVITTIYVNVEASCTFTSKTDSVYDNYTYNISDLILVGDTAKPDTAISSVTYAQGESDLYVIQDNKIIFNALAYNQQAQIIDVELAIVLNNYENVIINKTLKLKVNHRIVSLYEDEQFILPEALTVDEDGNVTISQAVIKQLFTDNKDNNVTGIADLTLLVNGKTADIQNIKSYVGAITSTQHNYAFEFKLQKNGTVLAVAKMLAEIKPLYLVTTNYPTLINGTGELETLKKEFVQLGGSVKLTESNPLSTDKTLTRIKVQKGVSSADYEFDVLYNGKLVYNGDNVYDEATVKVNTKDITFKKTGEYSIVIYPEGNRQVAYSTYEISVTYNSPLYLNADDFNVLYVGNGDEDILKYVDLLITIPSEMSYTQDGTQVNVKNGDQITLWVEDVAGNRTQINPETKYFYNAGEVLRIAYPLENFVENSVVYVKSQGDASSKGTLCGAQFNYRGRLKYNDYFVPNSVAGNLISSVDFSLTDEQKTTLSQNGQLDIVSLNVKPTKLSVVTDEIIGSLDNFVYKFNIKTNYTPVGSYRYNGKAYTGIDFVLNANESSNLSLVGLLGIADFDGNYISYNHIKLSDKEKTLSLSTSGICSLIEPKQVKVNETLMIYDYNILLLGASNDGTKQDYTLTWTVNGISYQRKFNILILPNIVFEMRNNDGTTNPNGEANPLKLIYGGSSFTFISQDQTNYVKGYNKFDSAQKNLAHLFNRVVTGNGKDYISLTASEDGTKLTLRVEKPAEFGNKQAVITFQDNYGLSYNYYIEIIASRNVESVKLTAGGIYEGDTIYVFNPSQNSTLAGVAVTIRNVDSANSLNTEEIEIQSAGLYINQKSYNGIINLAGTNQIEFNVLGYQEYWQTLGNGLSINASLRITIKLPDIDETYSFNVAITLSKRYGASISNDNTYLREGVSVDYAHLVDVFDYKQAKYLGKPELVYGEKIKTNGHYYTGVDIPNTIGGVELADLISDIAGREPTEEESKTLSKFGITYVPNSEESELDFVMILGVTAINKLTKEEIFVTTLQKVVVSAGDTTYAANFDVTLADLGFNSSISSSDYDFVVSMVESTEFKKVVTLGSTTAFKFGENTTESPANLSCLNTTRVVMYYADGVSGTSLQVCLKNGELTESPYFGYGGNKNSTKTLEGTWELYTGESYINGLKVDTIKAAKGISAFIQNGQTVYSYNPQITSNLTHATSSTPAYGSGTISGLYIQYHNQAEVDENNYTTMCERVDSSVYVTLRYTGVNTDKAYVSSSVAMILMTDLSTNNGVLERSKTIALDTWSKDFTLQTGKGLSYILSGGENKTLSGNKTYLNFRVGKITTTTGELVEDVDSSFVSVSSEGIITLGTSFKPNEYYASIIVECKYGADNKCEQIAELFLQFAKLNTATLYGTSGSDEVKISLSGVTVNSALAEHTVSMGLATIVDYSISGSSLSYIIVDNGNKAITDSIMLLVVDDVLYYVQIVNKYIYDIETPSISGNTLLGITFNEKTAFTATPPSIVVQTGTSYLTFYYNSGTNSYITDATYNGEAIISVTINGYKEVYSVS